MLRLVARSVLQKLLTLVSLQKERFMRQMDMPESGTKLKVFGGVVGEGCRWQHWAPVKAAKSSISH